MCKVLKMSVLLRVMSAMALAFLLVSCASTPRDSTAPKFIAPDHPLLPATTLVIDGEDMELSAYLYTVLPSDIKRTGLFADVTTTRGNPAVIKVRASVKRSKSFNFFGFITACTLGVVPAPYFSDVTVDVEVQSGSGAPYRYQRVAKVKSVIWLGSIYTSSQEGSLSGMDGRGVMSAMDLVYADLLKDLKKPVPAASPREA